jgi:hypothetical protein
MEQKENKSTVLVRVPKAWVIAMVAEQIKGKILFPKKVAEANRILDRARFVKKNN